MKTISNKSVYRFCHHRNQFFLLISNSRILKTTKKLTSVNLRIFSPLHPTQGALYDFDVSLNSDFINTCNNGDIFLDSALVINDGVFGGRGAWKDKLDNKGTGIWSTSG